VGIGGRRGGEGGWDTTPLSVWSHVVGQIGGDGTTRGEGGRGVVVGGRGVVVGGVGRGGGEEESRSAYENVGILV
jgi:hypothetical protein